MSGDALGWIAKCHRDEDGRRQRGEGGSKKKGGDKRKSKKGRKDNQGEKEGQKSGLVFCSGTNKARCTRERGNKKKKKGITGAHVCIYILGIGGCIYRYRKPVKPRTMIPMVIHPQQISIACFLLVNNTLPDCYKFVLGG